MHRLEIAIPRGYQLAPNTPLAMSPDGSSIVFGLLNPQMRTKLWLRALNEFVGEGWVQEDDITMVTLRRVAVSN